jgi:hypothetical protein
MRQDILSGSFFERGVKKLATALPDSQISKVTESFESLACLVLVVVDACFRFDGGGETPRSFELGRFPKLGRSTMTDYVQV